MTEKKPMPYIKWERRTYKSHDLGLPIDRYEADGHESIWDVDELAESKHLTDAECAAEYWRARLCSHIFLRRDVREQSALEMTTWERFATLPHAHEED